ncbi:MAG: gliding motility-associated C-terminal domain-containing protein [Bacteroidota bacterium]
MVDPGCAEENNGSIDLTPIGGTGTYSYAWSNGDGPLPAPNTDRQDIDNLPPGDYTVVITSGTQEITLTIGVDEPDPIVVTGMVAAATSGNNGSITLTPGGGNDPYSFAWTDGPTTQNRTDLTPGEYCVVVTDNSDCSSAEQCFTVGAAPVSFLSTSTQPASCSDGEDGTIRLVVENGARPFTVRLEPLGTETMVDDNTIEVMAPAGTYDVFVTDAQGAQIMTEVEVTAPERIAATGTVTSDTENDGCSGMISLNITGGTADYTVSWNNMDDGATISQLCAGAYVATITDDNGCMFTTDTFRVQRIDEDLDNITEVSCEGGNDGAIDVTIFGGLEPYTFSWTRTGDNTEIADTEDIAGITNGDYTLTIVDGTGAMLVRNYSVGITGGFAVNASVTSNFNGFGVNCFDAADGRAVATVSGQAEYTFEWFLDDTTVDTDSILDNVAAGTYQVIVTSSAGCEIERTVEITAPTPIVLETEITPITCGNTSDGAIEVTPMGGVGGYEFEWSNGSSSPRLSSLSAGTYGLTVTDGNGCLTEESYTLAAPEALAITFETTDATDGCNGSITVLPLGGNAPYRFDWPQLPNQGSSPVAEGLCPGEYTIEVTDATGCQTVTMVATVQDRRFPCLSGREVITPNGDGLNETFILFCSGEDAAINNSMEIYNRWGQLVFRTEDYNCSNDDGINCFEGRTNDGTPLPAGPYYYIFNFTNPIGEEMQQRGSLTIVRE